MTEQSASARAVARVGERQHCARDEERSEASTAIGWGGVWRGMVPCCPGGSKGRGALAPVRVVWAGAIRTSEASENIPLSDRERAEGFQSFSAPLSATLSVSFTH